MKLIKQIITTVLTLVLLLTTATAGIAYLTPDGHASAAYFCGSNVGKKDKEAVETSINFGCKGLSCRNSKGGACNPALDALFAIIRFLSDGAGLVLVLGLIIAGIQFTASGGDPQRRSKALSRVYHVVIALFVFIFAYAILNFLIPAGFFQ